MTGNGQKYVIHTKVGPDQRTAVASATMAVAEFGRWLGTTYQAVSDEAARQGVELTGPPFARYRRRDDGRFHVEAGFPVAAVIYAAHGVRASHLTGGPTATTTHTGPYDRMEPAYEAVAGWLRDNGAKPVDGAWEIYLSDPAAEPDPAAWRTEVVQPYVVTSPA